MTMVIHKFVKRHQYFLKYRNQRISQYYSSSHAPRPSSLGHGLAPRTSSHVPRPSLISPSLIKDLHRIRSYREFEDVPV